MEDEKQAQSAAAGSLNPDQSDQHGTNDEDQGGGVTVPASTAPPTGDAD